jgi:hypothetical protein
MNWDWKKYVKKNSYKILAHQLVEYSVLGTVYIAMEGDPIFWPIGIILGSAIHLLIFTKIDFLHQLHHHHSKKKGHSNHEDT